MSTKTLRRLLNSIAERQQRKKGSIHLILGPMFSGKSTELLRRKRRYMAANKRCVVAKYVKDTRSEGEVISTHDGETSFANKVSKLDHLETVIDDFQSVEVILIDEGQFFPDIISFSEKMANSGRIVVIAALDGTFQRKPFGQILDLVPLAEEVVKMTAVCFYCKEDAGSFSYRTVDNKEILLIGGSEKYHACCRTCYLELNGMIEWHSALVFADDESSEEHEGCHHLCSRTLKKQRRASV